MELIGDMGKLGRLKWDLNENEIILDPFKWRLRYNKCWKKVVKGGGIFCGNFCVGCGQYPPCQMLWCGGCYVTHPKYDFHKSWKQSGGDWEV